LGRIAARILPHIGLRPIRFQVFHDLLSHVLLNHVVDLRARLHGHWDALPRLFEGPFGAAGIFGAAPVAELGHLVAHDAAGVHPDQVAFEAGLGMLRRANAVTLSGHTQRHPLHLRAESALGTVGGRNFAGHNAVAPRRQGKTNVSIGAALCVSLTSEALHRLAGVLFVTSLEGFLAIQGIATAAVHWLTHAKSIDAQVRFGADVAILAGSLGGLTGASIHRIAQIYGADVVVITSGRFPGAFAGNTDFVHRAKIFIDAGGSVQVSVETPLSLVALVSGARIAVIAVDVVTQTGAIDAFLVHGADQPVITRGIEILKGTTPVAQTLILSARVGVTTLIGFPGTEPCFALVSAGAGVAIVAKQSVLHPAAPLLWIAGVVGTRVAIIAVQRCTRTASITASIELRAGVAVVASGVVRRGNTPKLLVAGVVGAGVRIVTIDAGAGADPTVAYVLSRAGVAVVAHCAVVGVGASHSALA